MALLQAILAFEGWRVIADTYFYEIGIVTSLLIGSLLLIDDIFKIFILEVVNKSVLYVAVVIVVIVVETDGGGVGSSLWERGLPALATVFEEAADSISYLLVLFEE